MAQRDYNLEAKLVAYLVAEENKRQDEVKELLNIRSQTEVSRLLQHAVQQRWVKRWQLLLPDEERLDLAQRVFPRHAELAKRLESLAKKNEGPPPKDFLVVCVPDDRGTTPRDYLKRFGERAADYVVRLLKKRETKTCAVAWGQTIQSVIGAISNRAQRGASVLFVPVSGEPLRVRDIDFSPTAAARDLARAFGSEDNYLSLAGVAARIPKDLEGSADAIRKFVGRCNDYATIFGNQSPVIKRVDMILAGVGDASTSKEDPWFKETLDFTGISDLSAFAAGNISGVWIAKDPARQSEVQEMNGHWLGIQREDFVECCKRAGDSATPGVVVVATGVEKAQIVSHVIGMVSHLIIDRKLAEALLS